MTGRNPRYILAAIMPSRAYIVLKVMPDHPASRYRDPVHGAADSREAVDT
jgi:hypothetical protein